MTFRVCFGFLIIALIGQSGYAQTVSLNEYLEKVRMNHPFFAKEALQTDIEKLGRDRFLGVQDWAIHSSKKASYQKTVANSTFAPDRVYTLDGTASVDRVFWNSGGRLSLTWQSILSDQSLPGITVPGPGGTTFEVPTGASRFYENRVIASYSHPLLQNRGGELDRLEYDLAGFNIDFSEVQVLENQENFLLDVGVRFVEWVRTIEQTRIARERLRLAEEQRVQTVRKRRVNLVDEVDVLRADDAVQINKEALVLNQSRERAVQAELAVLAQDPGMTGGSPDMDLYQLEEVPGIEDAIERVRDQRVVSTLRIRLQQLERQKKGLDDLAQPQLFLSVSGGLQEGDEDFIDALGLSKPDIGVALDFRYPLGNRTASADVAQSQLQIRQLEKEIESVSLNLESELRNLWIQITELVGVLALNKEQIETARKKTREEKRLYDQGRGELTFVIQSQDSEALAELRYAVNAATYHQLVLSYRAILDELLPAPEAAQ
jgi:outer membrane protein TolC